MELQLQCDRNKVLCQHQDREVKDNPIPEYLESLIAYEDLACDILSPREFLNKLRWRGVCHPTARHPFFVGMATGTLPNVPLSLLDFSLQKMKLREHFHRNTCDLVENGCVTIVPPAGEDVSDPLSRLVHLDQMQSAPAGVSHVILLKRFHTELEREVEEPLVEFVTHKLSRPKNLGSRLSEITKRGNAPFVIGALCCKIQPVISEIYKLIIEAIEKYTHLPPRAYFFFQYSIQTDSVLLGVLERLAEEYLISPKARIDAAKGYFASLNIVYRYFMEMYDRSLQFPPKKSRPRMEYLTTRVYKPLSQEILYEEDESIEDSEPNTEATVTQTKHMSSLHCCYKNADSVETCNSSELADDYDSLPRNMLNVDLEYRKVSPMMKLCYGEESPLDEDLRRLSLNL